LGVDSNFLTGKYTGQLAAAIGVDGHRWMFPVAIGIFEKENTENWVWFMQQLKICIGDREGPTIHTDACKGLENAINVVYPNCEHRECMMHLMLNFKKKFKGDILDNMWPATWTYEAQKHESFIAAIEAANPDAIAFLKKNHDRVWTTSKFSSISKVEYVSNNLAEVFNNWIREKKQLAIVELVDTYREMVMLMRGKRREVANKLQGTILPSVVKELIQKSKGLRYGEVRATPTIAVISGNGWRHTVDLGKKECSCRH
jgi:transposase-like protein